MYNVFPLVFMDVQGHGTMYDLLPLVLQLCKGTVG